MKRLLVVVLTLAFAVPAQAHLGGRERVMRLRCDQHHVRACVTRAAIHRHVSEGWLRATAWCESRYDPLATNGQYIGTFQWGPVWYSTPYAHRSRWSAKWASLAAAWAFSRGYSSWWACA